MYQVSLVVPYLLRVISRPSGVVMKDIVEDELKRKIQKKLETDFSKTIDNPVVKEHQSWNIIS